MILDTSSVDLGLSNTAEWPSYFCIQSWFTAKRSSAVAAVHAPSGDAMVVTSDEGEERNEWNAAMSVWVSVLYVPRAGTGSDWRDGELVKARSGRAARWAGRRRERAARVTVGASDTSRARRATDRIIILSK